MTHNAQPPARRLFQHIVLLLDDLAVKTWNADSDRFTIILKKPDNLAVYASVNDDYNDKIEEDSNNFEPIYSRHVVADEGITHDKVYYLLLGNPSNATANQRGALSAIIRAAGHSIHKGFNGELVNIAHGRLRDLMRNLDFVWKDFDSLTPPSSNNQQQKGTTMEHTTLALATLLKDTADYLMPAPEGAVSATKKEDLIGALTYVLDYQAEYSAFNERIGEAIWDARKELTAAEDAIPLSIGGRVQLAQTLYHAADSLQKQAEPQYNQSTAGDGSDDDSNAVRSMLKKAIDIWFGTVPASQEMINKLRTQMEATYAALAEHKLTTFGSNPKTVNIVLVNVNATAIFHDGAANIAGLADEMVQRGGRIFTFMQKDQSADDVIMEAAALSRYINDPLLHSESEFILVSKEAQFGVQLKGEPFDTVFKTISTMTSGAIKDRVNSFTFTPDTPTTDMSTVLYNALFLAMTPFKTPIMQVDTVAVNELRNQLLNADNALKAIGLATNMLAKDAPSGKPLSQKNAQAFGSSAQPFPNQMGRFGEPTTGGLFGSHFMGMPMQHTAWGQPIPPMPAGNGPFGPQTFGNQQRQPFGSQVNPMGFGSEMYGFKPKRTGPMGYSMGAEEFGQAKDQWQERFDNGDFDHITVGHPMSYNGTIVIHSVGQDMSTVAQGAVQAFSTYFPNAAIAMRPHDPRASIDLQLMPSDMQGKVIHFIHARHDQLLGAVPIDNSDVGKYAQNLAAYLGRIRQQKVMQISSHDLHYPALLTGRMMHLLQPETNNVRFFTGNIVLHYTGSEQEMMAKSLADLVSRMLPGATIIPVGYDILGTKSDAQQRAMQSTAWREASNTVHFVMQCSAQEASVVDGVGGEVFAVLASLNQHVRYITSLDLRGDPRALNQVVLNMVNGLTHKVRW